MWLENPVLRKEIMTRYRPRQVYSVRVGVLVAIGLALCWLYYTLFSNLARDPAPNTTYFYWGMVVVVQFAIICVLAPSVAANSISQEREQQSWEMLVFTRLTPGEIIFGKLIARMIPIAGVILLGLPISAICWMLWLQHGGPNQSSSLSITPVRFVGVYVLMLLAGLFFAIVGMFASWMLRRTLFAIIASYTFVIGFLLIGTLILSQMFATLTSAAMSENFPLLWVNPAVLFSLVAFGEWNDQDIITVVGGVFCYVSLSVALILRMLYGFRRYSREA